MENSLVIQKRKRTLTTSLVVAEKFGKRHDLVLRKIEDLMEKDKGDLLIFEEIFYPDSYGREQKTYVMDRKSFSMLVMSFTGQKAFDWKLKFYDAFEAMELAILEHKNKAWEEARLKGKQVRHELTDEIQSFIDRSIGFIKVETVSRSAYCYRTGRVVAISVAEVKDQEATS